MPRDTSATFPLQTSVETAAGGCCGQLMHVANLHLRKLSPKPFSLVKATSYRPLARYQTCAAVSSVE